MLCKRWHQLIPVLDVGMQPTLLETTTSTSTSTPSANPRRLRNACCVQNNAKLADQLWGNMFVLLTRRWNTLTICSVWCSLSRAEINDFQQLGLASHRPEDVALAAFELLYLNPKHPQYQNTAPCQYNISKLSIVLPIKREQKGDNKEGIWTDLWCAFPKAEVLDGVEVDGWSVDGVLKKHCWLFGKAH